MLFDTFNVERMTALVQGQTVNQRIDIGLFVIVAVWVQSIVLKLLLGFTFDVCKVINEALAEEASSIVEVKAVADFDTHHLERSFANLNSAPIGIIKNVKLVWSFWEDQ